MTSATDDAPTPAVYGQLLEDIKVRIRDARVGAALAVNRALIELYWQIGTEILLRERAEGWGTKVIDRLAADLRREFPDMAGLSRRNLQYMRTFAAAWPGPDDGGVPIAQQAVAQLPWGQNLLLLTKLRDRDARAWYAERAVEHGWSRAVLSAQLATGLRERSGTAISSFGTALPPPDSDLVRDTIKDPYNFEFLRLTAKVQERDLEAELLRHVESFLIEMGRGFALVGRQWPLRIPNDEAGVESQFFIDLLFFNYLLNRFVVIDLKVEDFKPEFAGKMNFYLNAVDELERQPGHRESIGLILCPGRDRTVTEWALRGLQTPVAVARYVTADMVLTAEAPAELQPALPQLPALASELASTVEALRRERTG